jgi:putative transposase
MPIKLIVKPEQVASGRAYNSLIVDNAVLEAKRVFQKICRTNKGKTQSTGLSTLGFKSKKKGTRHSFRLCRFPKLATPAKAALGDVFFTEKIPDEAIGKEYTVSFEKGRWFANVQQHIFIQAEKQGRVKCVAIDPGVRTFATCYSESEVIIAGENLAKERLYPLMLQADKIISQRQLIYNQFPKVHFAELPQWARDRLTNLQNRLYKVKCKKDDIIRDHHHRLAFELVSNYDVLFLPTFETKGMVRRRKGRVIRRNTCRQMLDLCHYKFKLLLKWYAKKYGKHVVDCCEAYTTKTLSWSGQVIENIGGRKTVNDKHYTVDRDINAARGILIKALTKAA